MDELAFYIWNYIYISYCRFLDVWVKMYLNFLAKVTENSQKVIFWVLSDFLYVLYFFSSILIFRINRLGLGKRAYFSTGYDSVGKDN